MADNIVLNSGTGGATLAADDITSVWYQIIKLAFGALDTATLVTSSAGLPVEVVAALPAGTAAIGKLAANSGVDIGDVDVTSVIPGTGATNLGKAIDSVGGATDTGVVPLAVRDDALSALTPLEGDYVALRVDANGALWVHDDALDAALAGSELQVDVVAALPAGDNNIGNVDIVTVPAPLNVVGTGLEATALRVTLASDSTGVLSVDDNGTNLSVDWGGTVPPIGAGVEATALRVTLATDSTGVVSVDDNAGALTVDWAGTAPPIGAGVEATALRVTLATDSTGVVSVDDNAGSLTVDVGVALPAGDNNIGNVDIVTLPASTNTLEVVGDVAHDAGVAGNPILVCGAAQNMDDTAPPNRISAESDAARFATDWDGALFAHPHGPQVWSYHSNGSAALTDAAVHAAPGLGLSLYVGTIVFSAGAATAINAFLEEGASTVLGPYYLEAVAGRGAVITFNPPKKITANTALTLTTSAAIAHAVDITGFTAQG